ncbi:MAG TPA: DNA alkylation repair protein [Candidatus Polarisedimenticolaceae bacterium]
MTLTDVLSALDAADQEPPKKRVSRLAALKKSIGTDDALARALWETGRRDARVLATTVADPGHVDRSTLDAWAGAVDDAALVESFSRLAGAVPGTEVLARTWIDAQAEWTQAAGWSTLGQFVGKGGVLTDAECVVLLARIDAGLRDATPGVRDAMNGALIAIGARGGSLQKKALVVAKRISKILVGSDAVEQIHRLGDRANVEKFWSR